MLREFVFCRWILFSLWIARRQTAFARFQMIPPALGLNGRTFLQPEHLVVSYLQRRSSILTLRHLLVRLLHLDSSLHFWRSLVTIESLRKGMREDGLYSLAWVGTVFTLARNKSHSCGVLSFDPIEMYWNGYALYTFVTNNIPDNKDKGPKMSLDHVRLGDAWCILCPINSLGLCRCMCWNSILLGCCKREWIRYVRK